jgi:DNA recombination protein RmuC
MPSRVIPTYLAHGIAKRVVIATPTTAIALLLAVKHGWKQDELTSNIKKIGELTRDLHDALCNMFKNSAGGLMELSLVTTR